MVTINLTLNTPEELKLTADYLNDLANLSIGKGQEQIADKPKKQTASKPKTEKVEEEPQIQPQAQAQPKVEEVAEEKPAVEEVTNKESEIKISDLRTLLSKKVDEHRDDIKAKLTELGAKNVTTLDESKYEEFYTFLKDLK